ncbi:hypothetical protein Afil01_66900 [Actinorhabdospora filicis]|uniref:AMMECR1 domain-containing protein n=1 Tax=Actinorhabdospora filicis TaxID=1785913 RepID=A0A9W6STP7_9ACTN|nr:AmmeMemoRadiSam system protein A [Actinorhabdospora filicis]GLZ81883.1 hypothetical protein Afil01_66900 [Actinorhabdospora filicis]
MAGIGDAVTRIALDAVRARLTGTAVTLGDLLTEADPAELREPGASFVTLEHDGRLRGCIGTLEARRALYADIAANAQRSMRDPRMPPVEAGEWPGLTVKVSVLTSPEPVAAATPRELLDALRPGVDGLILSDGTRRATFLPAVWTRLTEPRAFLSALLRKGGWTAWPEGVWAARYESREYISDPPPGGRP